MATITIEILGINPDGTLKLPDNGNTVAKPEDVIQWTIGPNSGVSSIVNIIDTSIVDVFNPDPKKLQNNSPVWSGTINKKITTHCHESYSINYTKIGGTEIYNSDPKIQIN